MRKTNNFKQAKRINSHFVLQTLNRRKKKYFADFEQVKKIVILLTLKKSFVKISFWRNLVNYGTPCHAIGQFVFWYHRVTYKTPCYTSGHLVIYGDCYGFETAFFTLGRFLPCTPSRCFQGFPGAGSLTSKLAGLQGDLNI